MTITEAEIGGRTFGCELEYSGISQEKAANTVAAVVGGTARYEGWHLNNWVVVQPDGRKWQVVSDNSISGEESAEVVTPILWWRDMETLQEVVRALRRNGARANESTGLHVHIGAADLDGKGLKNLVRTFYKQETLILNAAGTYENRLGHYTKRTDHGFVDRICAMRNPTKEKVADAYYEGYDDRDEHYSDARYRALNLHNLWYGSKGTVEFRFFNGTTHAGRVKTAVQLSLLIVIRAKSAKASSAKNQRPYSATSANYDLRVFLLRLGANGPMFKTMRTLLMRNLPGSAAWKDGRHD